MEPVSSKKFLQTFIWASILLSGLAIIQTVQRVDELEIILWRSKWIFLLGIFALNIAAGVFILRSSLSLAPCGLSRTRAGVERISRWMDGLEFDPSNNFKKLYGLVLVILGFSLVWAVRLFFFGRFLPQLTPILWVFLWASLLQTFGLKLMSGFKWYPLFAAVILLQGLAYQVYGRIADISDYPFSIGYSEASRHYYASLFYAKSLYDAQVPYPFLHPSRYLLMSLPFLIDGLPLWFHRMWQSLLWLGLTSASAVLLVHRMRLSGWMKILAIAWAFLYFLQGAVYYHLQVCVILVLAGVSVKHPWRSLLFVLLASIWAGISRVNWFPVPAMLGIAIYILETPFAGKGWRYWIPPFLLGVAGLGTALAAQFIYINSSGNADVSAFGSSFTSDLLWNRLLPNSTYPLGILPGILIVAAPLGIALYQMLHGKLANLHPLRSLALLALLLILFLGGLVVSTKIGGGGDLHNMDAFLVMFALIATSFFAGRVVGDGEPTPGWGNFQWGVAALLVPLGFALPQIGFFNSYDHVNVEKDIQRLQQVVSEAVANGGEVLFITERQLLTFDELKNVLLIPEYEQIELMEMAMSGNREYLEQYYSDLDNRRFALVIAEEQKYSSQKKGSFIEESNAWVRYIGAPLLCAYKPLETLLSNNVQIFEPRPGRPVCKDPFAE
jgi:hypothetical protein